MGTKQAARLPRGVSIKRHKSGSETLRLYFVYEGTECREPLGIPPTKANIKFAEQLLHGIKLDQARGTFDYEATFPNSKRARLKREREEVLASQEREAISAPTIGELVWKRMQIKRNLTGQNGWERSTYDRRESLYNRHIKPNWGHLRVQDLRPHHIRDWLEESQGKFGAGHAEMVLSLLNPIIEVALAEDVIAKHPYRHISVSEYLHRPTTKERKEKIDPLNEMEIARLLESIPNPIDRNYLQFCIFTGVRMQEGPVVRWDNIDWQNRTLLINQAVGRTKTDVEYIKDTKTGEDRVIELLEPAWEAIMRQRELTQLRGEYIFYGPRARRNSGTERYTLASVRHTWLRELKRAGLRYSKRTAKQTRHTFCSLMLSAGEPPSWVRKQTGHTSTVMFDKHYAKWVEIGAAKRTRYSFGDALKEAQERERLATGFGLE